MGTRGFGISKAGVLVATLSLAAGCGGRYDVGNGEDTGGVAGTAGSAGGDDGKGGSSVNGGTGASGGGVAGSNTGGTGAGGSASSGGAAIGGGSGGTGSVDPSCTGVPAVLPPYPAASPEVVWERLSRFLYDEVREPPEALPEETSVEWVSGLVESILDEGFVNGGRAPEGLTRFVRDWAFDGHEDADAEFWARPFVAPVGNFVEFFRNVGDRFSIMSDQAFLVAHPNSTKRGLWMASKLFCNVPSGPPIEIEPVVVPPGKTRRQVIEETVASATCAGCHQLFDPLGFSLENYDSLGEYRTTENGLPIDASGSYSMNFEGTLEFESIRDLSNQLVRCQVQACFSRHLLEDALSRAYEGDPPAYEPAELVYATDGVRNFYNRVGPLVTAVATTPAFLRE